MTSGMKETSSPWMPEVPESWTVLPARYCVTSRQNGSWGESPLNEGEGEFCLRAADFDYEHLGLKPRESFTRRVYSEAEFERVKVRRGDLIVEKSGGGEKTPVGRAVLIKNPIDVAFSNFLERLTVDSLKCIPEFFAYWWTAGYQSASFVPFFNQTTGIQNLNTMKLLASNVIALPESEEQYAIVELLDEECAKIDQAMDLLQQELDALEQLKKSIIYEAVTKGLDPTVPMKPSGVEWIGDIPMNWEAKKLKFIASFGSGTTPDSDDYSYYDGGDIPWIQSGDLYDTPQLFSTDKNVTAKAVRELSALSVYKAPFVVVAMYGASIGNTSLSIIDACMNQACCYIRATHAADDEYLFYAITSAKLDLMSKAQGGTQPNISQIVLKNQSVPCPPLVEQKRIVEAIEQRVKDLDHAIAIKRSQFNLLRQQRRALIFEYVTGKRRVNEVA